MVKLQIVKALAALSRKSARPGKSSKPQVRSGIPRYKAGRNQPCPCGRKNADGSPIKFKHCCIRRTFGDVLEAVAATVTEREAQGP